MIWLLRVTFFLLGLRGREGLLGGVWRVEGILVGGFGVGLCVALIGLFGVGIGVVVGVGVAGMLESVLRMMDGDLLRRMGGSG